MSITSNKLWIEPEVVTYSNWSLVLGITGRLARILAYGNSNFRIRTLKSLSKNDSKPSRKVKSKCNSEGSQIRRFGTYFPRIPPLPNESQMTPNQARQDNTWVPKGILGSGNPDSRGFPDN
eukprot:1328285-Amorphochlora_amoeboformis.AAC.1